MNGPRDDLLAQALEQLGGAALVLDQKLRVQIATPAAEELLRFTIPIGESAPKLLCGSSPKRPVAEALAEGRPITATIENPGRGPDHRVAVRSIPLGPARARTGWVLLLDDARAADAEGALLFSGMWTQDQGMKDVFRVIERVASEDAAVLVRGETGSGKELVAQALHALSQRRRGPFRAINCAALPPNLLESELFGHARGAFTGAVKDAPGHFQLAHTGTLFLDEVAELPLELQAKLLRVLETKSILPVGGRQPVSVDVRIVSATHRSLRQEVEAGRFRADVMYRLRVIPIYLPPLRERPGDVRLLTEKLVAEANLTHRRRIEKVSDAAFDALTAYEFAGNVRELRNILAYAYAIGDGPVLVPSDLPPEILEPSGRRSAPREPVVDPELSEDARKILRVIDRVGGSRERAAQVLGISRVTLWRRMRELGLGDVLKRR